MKNHVLAHLLALASASAHAEDRHIDPGIWFASPAAEATDRKILLADADAPPVLDNPSPGALLDYLHRAESLLGRNQRHAAWLHLRTALDIDDHAADEARNAVGDAADTVVERTRQTLRKIGDDGFAKDVAALPALGTSTTGCSSAPRGHSRTNSLKTSKPSPPRHPTRTARPSGTSTRRPAGAPPTAAYTPRTATWMPEKDADKLAADADRGVREQAWKQRQAALAAQAETYASILVGIVRLNDRAAKMHVSRRRTGSHALRASFHARRRGRHVEGGGGSRVRAAGLPTLTREHVAHVLGTEQAHSWDLSMPTPGFIVHRRSMKSGCAA